MSLTCQGISRATTSSLGQRLSPHSWQGPKLGPEHTADYPSLWFLTLPIGQLEKKPREGLQSQEKASKGRYHGAKWAWGGLGSQQASYASGQTEDHRTGGSPLCQACQALTLLYPTPPVLPLPTTKPVPFIVLKPHSSVLIRKKFE